jgi:[ribosomal protein S5]-alanine N-acetyltransferase
VVLGRQLETQRMMLAALETRHASGPYFSWMNDAQTTRFLESRFRRFERVDLESYIEAANAADDTLLLGMFLKNDGQRHIGNIKLVVDKHHQRGEIGLMIGEADCYGRGLGSEAIAAVTDYAFRDLKLHKVTAGCYGGNVGSVRAFLKVGFAQEGLRPSHYRSGESWDDLILLGKINRDAG